MTDPRSRRSWCISDAVIRLRKHGAGRVYPLPCPPIACTMGAAGDLLLHDPKGMLSREHAQLVPTEIDGTVLWKIYDLKSKNGLRCDGDPVRTSIPLRPGVEIDIGSLRLIAESEKLIGLLSVLRRFLGLAMESQEYVDKVLQNLRSWAAQRAELIVLGDGDLKPMVRRLHNLVVGADVPFTWHESTETIDAAAIVKAASTGTLCIKMQRQADAVTFVERVHELECGVRPQLILCTGDAAGAEMMKRSLDHPAVIHVPPLASRFDELEEIVQGFAKEIAHEQGLPSPGVTAQDLEQLRALQAPGSALQFRSLADIEDGVLRLVMLRTWGLTPGAARLGLDHSSLRTWARRRGLYR